MNERIKELAEQAGITFKQWIQDGDEYDYYYVECNDNIGGDEAGCIKKFAELIIQECAMLVWNDKDQKRILKHFGVPVGEE